MRKKIVLPSVLMAALFMITGLALLGNANAQDGCSVADWHGRDMITDYLDTFTVAMSAPRASLAPVVIELQSRMRAFERSAPPECVFEAAVKVDEGMAAQVRGILKFLADEGNASIEMQAAHIHMQAAYEMFDELGITVDERLNP